MWVLVIALNVKVMPIKIHQVRLLVVFVIHIIIWMEILIVKIVIKLVMNVLL